MNGICCVLLVAYVFVLVMHRHTNVKNDTLSAMRDSQSGVVISVSDTD
jgi:hypothetical protein